MSARRTTGPIAYGIDFGTTNSSIAVAYPDRVEVVPVEVGEMAEVLPSIVYLHRDRNRAAGREAVEQFLVTGSHRTRCGGCELVEWVGGRGYSDCRQYRLGGGCHDARLVSGLKSELSQKDFVSTHSWAVDFTLADLVAVILRRLKGEADRFTRADVRRVVLGHPVVFVGAEGPDYKRRQATAEERLQRAAANAGFEEVALLEEPAAAVIEEALEEGIAIAADFGGGTFDVAVIRFSPDGGDVVALAGAEVGGEQFDRLLFQAKVAPALHIGDEFEVRTGVRRNLPNWLHTRLATLSGLKSLLSDPNTALTLREFSAAKGGRRLETVEEILYSGYGYQFYRAIEAAKITLSTKKSSSIEFHRPRLDISIPVTRSEFEELIASRMEIIRSEILKALEIAEISPEEVSLVLRTGGSSSIPAFVHMLEEIFDPSIVQERPVYTTVVHGLASYAQELWR
jgi:hypothetical chaperone protein